MAKCKKQSDIELTASGDCCKCNGLDLISRQAAIDTMYKIVERNLDSSVFEDGLAENPHIDVIVDELENLPSVEPERLTDDDFETIRIHLNAFKEKLCNQHRWEEAEEYQRIIDRLMSFASAEPERKTGKWIPFTSHVPDEEEKELYSDYEYILDGPLPESGQMILVTVTCAGHERVQADEFYSDDGCYLESGYDLVTEAVAWMPLPKPYRKESI